LQYVEDNQPRPVEEGEELVGCFQLMNAEPIDPVQFCNSRKMMRGESIITRDRDNQARGNEPVTRSTRFRELDIGSE